LRATSHLRYTLVLAALSFRLTAQAPATAVIFRELAAEALRSSPEVMAAQKRYEAARQRPAQESALPDPMFSLGYSSVGNPLPGAGIGREPQANAGVMVSQELTYPGKLKLKGEMAAKEAQAAFAEYQSAQLQVISKLKQAYRRLQFSYAGFAVLERNREVLSNLLKATENRYATGLAPQQDVFQAQIQLNLLEARLVKLEQERRSREAEISSILNRAALTPLGKPEDLSPKPLALMLDDLFAAARRNSPMLQRDRKMIERFESAVNIARKDYYPDVTLNGGYYNMGSMGSMYEVRADVKVPLYFWRKQRAGVTEQALGLAQARRTYEATDQTLRYRIQDDFNLAQASQKLMSLYMQTLAPQANLAVESSLASYQSGKTEFPSVLGSFTMSLDYAMNYYEEALNYSLALARLEEMTGEPLGD
jgi:outer membrane protein, heavy metal efflux system